jgi:hypothetical protein
MKSFLDFKSDFLFESTINESVLYLSPNFISTLNMIDSDISNELLSLDRKDIKPDITFVDIGDVGYATFKPMKLVKKHLSEELPDSMLNIEIDSERHSKYISIGNIYNSHRELWTKSKNPIRIGKLVNTIFPDRFTQLEVDYFVKKFKSVQSGENEKIYVVSGDEIAYWYDHNNYLRNVGTLGSSCMSKGDKSWFDIYVKNPEVCNMLVVTDLDSDGLEKLKGRALIWYPTNVYEYSDSEFKEFDTFLDRQYSIDPSIVEKMCDYANRMGWAYKTENSHTNLRGVTFNGKNIKLDMEVQLNKNLTYNYFPYLDTFRKFIPTENKLYNNNYEDDDGYLLNNDDGRFTNLSNPTVWSEWHDVEIDEVDAIWSEGVNSYIYYNSAVEVTSGSFRYRGYYPEDYDDIVFDVFNEDRIHIDDSIYSDHYKGYILVDESISVLSKIYDDFDFNTEYFINKFDDNYVKFETLEELRWFKVFNKITECDSLHDGILKSLLYVNNEDDWRLSFFKVQIFDTKGGDIKKLSMIDAKALGVDLDLSSVLEVDILDYYDYLISENIFNRLIKSLKLLKSDDSINNWINKLVKINQ